MIQRDCSSFEKYLSLILSRSEGAVHEVSDGAVGIALLEHEGHEEVRHGLRHIDLNATQQEQVWLATLGKGVVEVDVSVHKILQTQEDK